MVVVEGVPLHPMLTHLPLGLLLFLPPTGVFFFFFLRRNPQFYRLWLVTPVLHVILSLSIYVTMASGESEAKKIRKTTVEVAEAIQEHENAATVLLLISLIGIPISSAGLHSQRGEKYRIICFLLQLLLFSMGLWTAHLGGRLVYVYRIGPV